MADYSRKKPSARHSIAGGSSEQIGRAGEELAAQYLMDRGYEVLERNWRDGPREIDLITRKSFQLVFVEVKVSYDLSYGYPEGRVHARKIRSVTRAASRYLRKMNHQGEIRFDIIAITWRPKMEIHHIEDAFFPGW